MSSFLTFTSAYFFFFLPLRLIGWNSKSFPPEPLAMFFFSNESPIFSVNVTIGMQANHWVGWNIWLNLTSVCSHHRRSCFGQTGATSFMLQPPSKDAGGHTSNYLKSSWKKHLISNGPKPLPTQSPRPWWSERWRPLVWPSLMLHKHPSCLNAWWPPWIVPCGFVTDWPRPWKQPMLVYQS